MTRKQIIALIVCGALIGAATQAAGLLAAYKEILAAFNLLIVAVMMFIQNQRGK